MRAGSVDLRERAVAAVVVEGMRQVAAARRFELDRSSVGRFVGAFRAEQTSLAARLNGGGRPRVLRLREHLEAAPDLGLREPV